MGVIKNFKINNEDLDDKVQLASISYEDLYYNKIFDYINGVDLYKSGNVPIIGEESEYGYVRGSRFFYDAFGVMPQFTDSIKTAITNSTTQVDNGKYVKYIESSNLKVKFTFDNSDTEDVINATSDSTGFIRLGQNLDNQNYIITVGSRGSSSASRYYSFGDNKWYESDGTYNNWMLNKIEFLDKIDASTGSHLPNYVSPEIFTYLMITGDYYSHVLYTPEYMYSKVMSLPNTNIPAKLYAAYPTITGNKYDNIDGVDIIRDNNGIVTGYRKNNVSLTDLERKEWLSKVDILKGQLQINGIPQPSLKKLNYLPVQRLNVPSGVSLGKYITTTVNNIQYKTGIHSETFTNGNREGYYKVTTKPNEDTYKKQKYYYFPLGDSNIATVPRRLDWSYSEVSTIIRNYNIYEKIDYFSKDISINSFKPNDNFTLVIQSAGGSSNRINTGNNVSSGGSGSGALALIYIYIKDINEGNNCKFNIKIGQPGDVFLKARDSNTSPDVPYWTADSCGSTPSTFTYYNENNTRKFSVYCGSGSNNTLTTGGSGGQISIYDENDNSINSYEDKYIYIECKNNNNITGYAGGDRKTNSTSSDNEVVSGNPQSATSLNLNDYDFVSGTNYQFSDIIIGGKYNYISNAERGAGGGGGCIFGNGCRAGIGIEDNDNIYKYGVGAGGDQKSYNNQAELCANYRRGGSSIVFVLNCPQNILSDGWTIETKQGINN